jgi:hypothetical protein
MASIVERRRVEESTAQSVALSPSTIEMKGPTEPRVVAANVAKQTSLAAPKQKTDTQSANMFKSVETQVSTTAIPTNGGFTIQSTIRLSGKEVLLFTQKQVPFQIAWYAHKLTGGGSSLLSTTHANLIANKPEYTVSADLPRLMTGPYRLTTVVTFPTVGNLNTYYQGPVIQAT